uniref:protein-serine/threonine phosphatase n=1 Tax=Triticum urartu TaxID=4572 RepID=A0A8R7QK43_TRIUA
MAYVQANHLMEDHCRVESSPTLGTFVGIFDGHGGPEVARFTAEHLFPNLQPKATCSKQAVTAETIRKAFLDTDESFIALVEKQWAVTPNLAAVGSCCLVGVVHQRTLFVANLGNSRAVLGKVDLNGGICPVQLSTEHVASDENVRQELSAQHPDDPHIVVLKHDHWRVKGIQQVSRTIGDAYLKHQRFNREPLHSRFRLREPFSRPILSAEPSIISYSLKPSDRFIIFASDGLWEFLSNEEAIEIVHKNERSGIARRLIEAAVQGAARKRKMRYSDLKKIERGVRRHFHDDITVVVLFIDHGLSVTDHSQESPVLSISVPSGTGDLARS